MKPGDASTETLRELLHEIRTPLAALAALAPAVEAGSRDTYLSVLEHLSGILHRSLRCTDTTCATEAEAVDLASVIRHAVRLVAAAGHGVRFDVEGTEGLQVRGDRVLLTQILVNLLANAVRHAPAGTPVEVRAHASGEVVTVEVRDHGTGVPDELRDRVFADGASFGDHHGNGIGLALSRRLAERMHGSLLLTDEPGAVFALRVPAV